MVSQIIIQPYVQWQINRFDHLKAVTDFLRSQGIKPVVPKTGDEIFADDWTRDGEWLVWRSSKAIPLALVQDQFQFPHGVKLDIDPKTGSAIISCEKSKTSIAAQSTGTPLQIGSSGKIIIPQEDGEGSSFAGFFPLTDYLTANGCKPVFEPGNEALAKEAIERISLAESYLDFREGTSLNEILAASERGWLSFKLHRRYPERWWLSAQLIPGKLLEQFEFSPYVRIRENRFDDWQLSCHDSYCIMSMDQLRSF